MNKLNDEGFLPNIYKTQYVFVCCSRHGRNITKSFYIKKERDEEFDKHLSSCNNWGHLEYSFGVKRKLIQ